MGVLPCSLGVGLGLGVTPNPFSGIPPRREVVISCQRDTPVGCHGDHSGRLHTGTLHEGCWANEEGGVQDTPM